MSKNKKPVKVSKPMKQITDLKKLKPGVGKLVYPKGAMKRGGSITVKAV